VIKIERHTQCDKKLNIKKQREIRCFFSAIAPIHSSNSLIWPEVDRFQY
jgi:hypothetical protein